MKPGNSITEFIIKDTKKSYSSMSNSVSYDVNMLVRGTVKLPITDYVFYRIRDIIERGTIRSIYFDKALIGIYT